MAEKIHVMLVDDQADFVEPIAFWLESKGYSVSIASSGEKAIQIVKEKNPHIIFLDINMPVMNGIETLRRIREFNQQIPVIMVTAAYAEENRFFQAQELKTSGFFPKTGSLEEMHKTIELTLSAHKKLHEREGGST